jgi:hypothetical protein
MNNDVSIYDLIRESQCSEPWLFDEWLKTNKPVVEICYSDISMAFWNLSQRESQQSPSLTTKQVSVDLCTTQSTKNIENVGIELFNIKMSEQEHVIAPLTKVSDINPSIAKAILQGVRKSLGKELNFLFIQNSH